MVQGQLDAVKGVQASSDLDGAGRDASRGPLALPEGDHAQLVVQLVSFDG